jgi:hypothetical protein
MTKDRFRVRPAVSIFFGRCLALLIAGITATPGASAAGALCARPVADAIPLLETMERAWGEVSDYTAHLSKTERFVDGTIITERASLAFRKPNQLSLRLLEGANAGAELLFPKPGTDNIVLARPGGVSGALAGFLLKVPGIGTLVPYEFTLDDERLMAGQHHPLADSTIAGMLRLIATDLRAAVRRQEGGLCFHAGELVDGRQTIKVEVLLPPDVGTWHTVADGETVKTISRDYRRDRHVILYNNPSVPAKKTLSADDRIFVPQYYAPRVVLWVSAAFNLPVKLQMFDVEDRLYESYTNVSLRIDVGLDDKYFDPALHGFPAVATSGGEPAQASSGAR